VWSEEPNLWDWDPDISDPSLFYEIRRAGGQVVVPKTWLGLDTTRHYAIHHVVSTDQTLICAYDRELWADGLLVVFDATTRESWPRLKDDEAPGDEAVQRKWRARYARLRQEHPELPAVGALEASPYQELAPKAGGIYPEGGEGRGAPTGAWRWLSANTARIMPRPRRRDRAVCDDAAPNTDEPATSETRRARTCSGTSRPGRPPRSTPS
jgi:hypothetical protein